jgi:hypothetical protein
MEKMIKRNDKKLTINNQWYINLDSVIRPETCPDPTDCLIKSYDFIINSCPIRTFDLNNNQIKDAWYCLNNEFKLNSNSAIFEAEMKNKARSPYNILTLRKGGQLSYVYDSLDTPTGVWDTIVWKDELKEIWKSFIDWVEKLPISRIGHISFFLNKPEVTPHYHVDSGNDNYLEHWKPIPHRQEFIWINFSSDKSFYILDNECKPQLIKSKSAFFNTNNFHGSHEASPSWSYSVRIECMFSEELRKQLSIDHIERYYYEESVE